MTSVVNPNVSLGAPSSSGKYVFDILVFIFENPLSLYVFFYCVQTCILKSMYSSTPTYLRLIQL